MPGPGGQLPPDGVVSLAGMRIPSAGCPPRGSSGRRPPGSTGTEAPPARTRTIAYIDAETTKSVHKRPRAEGCLEGRVPRVLLHALTSKRVYKG